MAMAAAVAAEHERITRAIISKLGFSPVMECAHWSKVAGLRLGDFGEIIWPVGSMPAEPGEIEDADVAVFLHRASLLRHGKRAFKGIGGGSWCG